MMYVKNIQSIQQYSTINKAVDSIYLNTNNGKLYLKQFLQYLGIAYEYTKGNRREWQSVILVKNDALYRTPFCPAPSVCVFSIFYPYLPTQQLDQYCIGQLQLKSRNLVKDNGIVTVSVTWVTNLKQIL